MKIAFFTWITNNYKNRNIDFNSFYKSFKYFHPDIDLIIFDDPIINKVFKDKPWLNTTNCKASFAKLIYNDYDLIINIDSDFYFFDRCEEILSADYEIAACANYNIVQNVSISPTIINGYNIPAVKETQYIQGGLIASSVKKFWDEYEEMSKELSNQMPIYENDVFNIIWHSGGYKTKILDGDYNFNSPNFQCYYNCASLGRINRTTIKNDKVYLDNRPMRCYHVAHGWHRRKDRVHELFPKPVSDWFYSKIEK